MPSLSVIDLSPKFLNFYKKARDVNAEERWILWQELYGFAAVPPTPEGQVLARQLLDSAWDKYQGYLPVIENGAEVIKPLPDVVLQSVCNLLEYQDVSVQLIVFVGGFDDNAFAYGDGQHYNVCIPIEQSPEKRALILPHEFTHAVHMKKAGFTGAWERSIAQVIMEEGLATRCTERLVPNQTIADYVGDEIWYKSCQQHKKQIYQGLIPFLSNETSESVFQFTMGKGTTGHEREAYFAGWNVVGHLLEQGYSLAKLAGLPASELPTVVIQALEELMDKM